MLDKDFIAHVKRNIDETWAIPQLLSEHMENTALRAQKNSDKFHSGEWGSRTLHGCVD